MGWAGVPLFFVLSGFLITRILIHQTELPLGEYLKGFYWRRTIRIFPLYYLYLAVNAVLALIMAWSLSGYSWFIFYLGNHYIGNNMPTPAVGIVGHLWSLAVEEQFYLVWPFVVFALTRHLKVICVGVIIASFITRYVILDATENPYLTILTLASCMDMLAAGALAVLITNRRVLIGIGLLGATIVAYGVYLVGYSGFAQTADWVPQASFMYTGYALLFCPLMRFAQSFKLLAAAPLRYIGKISYGLYIWHMLAIAIAHRIPVPAIAQDIFAVLLSFVIAMLSWRFFESRLLYFKDKFGGSGVSA